MAEADLEEIWRYTARHWSPEQAERYHRTIVETFAALAAGTRRGRATDVGPGYLKCPAGPHMIYFRDPGTRVEIIRILHARRDVDRHL